MFNEFFNQTNSQFADFAAPAKKFNTLAIDNFEKLTRFQLEAAKAYADLGVNQLRAALSVTDGKSLQAYVSNQQQVAKTYGEKLAADAQVLSELGKQFAADMQKLTQENGTAFAKPSTKKAAA